MLEAFPIVPLAGNLSLGVAAFSYDGQLSIGILADHDGKLWLGPEGERKYGFAHFRSLYAVFDAPQMFTVKADAREVGTVAGKHVTTIEGIGSVSKPHPLQVAFLDEQAGQCGYCLSGIIVEAKALLDRNPDPSRAEIAAALDNHLCRCGAHPRILRAVAKAAAMIREGVAP